MKTGTSLDWESKNPEISFRWHSNRGESHWIRGKTDGRVPGVDTVFMAVCLRTRPWCLALIESSPDAATLSETVFVTQA